MDNTIFDKYGIPRPPAFAGVVGSGPQAMYSLGGRWYRAGQKTPQGYLIDSYDPKSYTLGMSYGGVPVPVRIQGSSIPDYQPIFMRGTETRGTETEKDMERMNALPASAFTQDPSQQVKSIFTRNMIEQITKNFREYNPDDKTPIMTLYDYQQLINSGNAVPNSKYYIPYQSEDGNVDFELYEYLGDTGNE